MLKADTGKQVSSASGLFLWERCIRPADIGGRVRADGIGGQEGDHVPAYERWRARAAHRYRVYKQTVEFVYLCGTISGDWDLRRVDTTSRIQKAWAYSGR